jgi:hypothetical protein
MSRLLTPATVLDCGRPAPAIQDSGAWDGGLDAFVRAAPLPERVGIRALLALGRRPRGAALLRRLPAADQLARATLALGRYDDPAVALGLGWDADAIVARGRALRRREGRPA